MTFTHLQSLLMLALMVTLGYLLGLRLPDLGAITAELNFYKDVETCTERNQVLDLMFSEGRIYKTTDKSLIAVAPLSEQFLKFRKLYLNFALDNEITRYGIQSIAEGLLSSQSELEDLFLDLSGVPSTTDESLETLVSSAKHSRALKRLYLDVSYDQMITDRGIKHLSEGLISQISELQDLTLILGLYRIGDESLKSIASQVNQLKKLKNLRMAFSRSYPDDPNITDNGIKCLIEDLVSQLTDLQELDLDFSIDKISDESLKSFGCLASRLRNLKKLRLHLSWSEHITDIGVQHLAEGFISKLFDLEELTLTFWDLKTTTSEVLITISSHCRQLKQLKKLDLYISGSDNGITYLTENLISQLPYLEDLSLMFKHKDDDITDEALKVIASQAIHFKNLKKLTLGFNQDKTITDNGIGHLAEGLIPQLLDLEELTLGFYGLDNNITRKSLKNVVSSVKSLKNLKFFRVHVLSFHSGSMDVNLAKKELSFISVVEIV